MDVGRSMSARTLLIALAAAVICLGAPTKLYLQGGGDLLVSEYEVLEDRVRYYSSERSQWEEIPLEMVDLERTRKAEERREQRLEALRRESSRERAAERKARTELHNVPIEDGVYHYLNDSATAMTLAEVQTDSSGKRGFLKIISPIPVVAGKNTLFIEGARSGFVVEEDKPVFYIRQPVLSHFGLLRLRSEEKKKRRVAQEIEIIPHSKELVEEQEEIEVFRQQLAPGVYRVWPVRPLPPGEYAVFDFTPGEMSLRVWDFSLRPRAEARQPPS